MCPGSGWSKAEGCGGRIREGAGSPEAGYISLGYLPRSMFSRDGAPPSEPSLCLNGVSEPPPSLAASSQLRGDFDTGEAPPPAVAVARLAPYETTRTSSRTQTSKQVARVSQSSLVAPEGLTPVSQETGQVSIPGMSRLPSVEDLALVMHASRLGTESEPPLVCSARL